MTTASKLQLTLDNKNAVKLALQNKGANPTDVFSTYAGLIDELATSGVATPQIISPIDGATGVDASPIITASRFSGLDADGFADTHVASTWEFYSDSGKTNLLYTSGRDTVSLTSIDLDGVHTFALGIPVYVEVTHEGASGNTATSELLMFTTQQMRIGDVLTDGGIVFAQQGGDWLVAAPATVRDTRMWGLSGTDTILSNAIPDPNTGKYNTDVLTSSQYNSINDGEGSIGSPAAEYARSNGYDLPNRQETQLVHDNRAAIDAADTSGGGVTLAAIEAGNAPGGSTRYVWSSTEASSANANALDLRNNSWGFGLSKDYTAWVVPVKRIPV